MESWRKVFEYVLTLAVLCWLTYNEYENRLLIPKYEEKDQEETKFQYPPLPQPYPRKILRTPNYNIPLILVAGHPRSGTTLMRTMLDAHDMVRCGEETHIIPRIASSWDPRRFSKERIEDLEKAGISQDMLKRAVANFLLGIIVEHGSYASRFCNKDPMTMLQATYIKKLFPQSKFIFMVRDGRATVNSAIKRNVTISEMDLTSYEQSLVTWNKLVKLMHKECEELGPESCLPVYYEELILKTKEVMMVVLRFLELPWRSEVLRHEEFVSKDGGIKLNPKEPSTWQVSKARYEDALTSWVGSIPSHLLQDMDTIAPMLSVFGYDPEANPPPYGELKYRWGQRLSETSNMRTPYRRFMSSVYRKK